MLCRLPAMMTCVTKNCDESGLISLPSRRLFPAAGNCLAGYSDQGVSMSWAAGFWRAWIVISVAWACSIVALERPDIDARKLRRAMVAIERAEALLAGPGDRLILQSGEVTDRATVAGHVERLDEMIEEQSSEIIRTSLMASVPPVLVLLAGVAVAWVIAGFRLNRRRG